MLPISVAESDRDLAIDLLHFSAIWVVKYRYQNSNDNKGIRDAGSTADFRILFEILELKKLEI